MSYSIKNHNVEVDLKLKGIEPIVDEIVEDIVDEVIDEEVIDEEIVDKDAKDKKKFWE